VPVAGADYHPRCSIPGTRATTDVASLDNVNVEVPAQLTARQTDKAVYCSCRCDGPDKNARYCECPEGFQCEKLVDDLKITQAAGNLAGSYCIRAGSKYDPNASTAEDCTSPGPFRKGNDDNLTGRQFCGCPNENPPAECGARPPTM
jgi:hypothetical protein